MAQTYKTEGIILKRWPYKERDKMVRVLSRRYGKLTTRAISARKVKSKLAGHLEPFIRSDFLFAHSKTIDIIAGSSTLAAHRQLRESVQHNSMMSWFSEVVDRFTQERQRDDALYQHVLATYQWFDTHQANPAVLYAATLQLCTILGYHLELYECYNCKKTLGEAGNKLQYGMWSVECADCTTAEETVPLSAEVIKSLRFLQDQPFSVVGKLALEQETWQAVSHVVHRLLEYHGEKPLRSEPVFLYLLQKTAT